MAVVLREGKFLSDVFPKENNMYTEDVLSHVFICLHTEYVITKSTRFGKY